MAPKRASYKINASLWLYPGESANWHFITVPKDVSGKITGRFREFRRGWGSLPVSVTIGKTSWKTSIFPDGKTGTYLLPVKAVVRRAEGIEAGDRAAVRFTVLP